MKYSDILLLLFCVCWVIDLVLLIAVAAVLLFGVWCRFSCVYLLVFNVRLAVFEIVCVLLLLCVLCVDVACCVFALLVGNTRYTTNTSKVPSTHKQAKRQG